MLCKLCYHVSDRIFERRLLKKYDVSYWQCSNCEFMQTEEPYWLEEAYSSAISDLDLGPVNRAVTGSKMVEGVILAGFDPNAKFVDWGGGYGVFTRLMRDLGYDFYWRDRYCQNLFAKQFVADDGSKYELMTAFEVFEHLVDPMSEIESMLDLASNVFFTTLIPPSRLTNTSKWWYLALEHGQHVSIYSIKSLRFIAEKFGLHLSTDATGVHLLSRKPFSNRLFKMIAQDRRAARMLRIRRRKLRTQSLLIQDFQSVTGWTV
jgi:hypothetical protein